MTELAANIIAESMHAKHYVDRDECLLLEVFTNHRKNGSSLNVEDQKIVNEGQEILRKSTAGWDIYCKWKYGSTTWEKLSDLNPVWLLKMIAMS